MKTALLLLALTASAQPSRFGLPACTAPDQELADRQYFIACHSAERKVPVWVGYELTPEHLVHNATRLRRFQPDLLLSRPGATDEDYRHSGLTRGHLAPAQDFTRSEEAVRTTFLLSNAVPQYRGVNSGVWSRLEAKVRQLAAAADSTLIFTGPIFDQELEPIGENRVAVPTHLFKVVLTITSGEFTTYAAIVPNQPRVADSLDLFTTTIAEVERRTGLAFFANLSATRRM